MAKRTNAMIVVLFCASMSLLIGCGDAKQARLGPYNPPALDAQPANANSVTPVTQPAERHQRGYATVRKEQQELGQADLVFFGDSITWCWRTPPGQVVWKEYYAHRKALNLGIGGARTENILWQMRNGFADGYQAKVMVLMIGTNNRRATWVHDVLPAAVHIRPRSCL